MLFFIFGAYATWCAVLGIYLLFHPRTTMTLARWTLTLYLLVFGWLAGTALQTGLALSPLASSPHSPAQWILVGWGVWYMMATYAIVNPVYLVPTALASILALGFPGVMDSLLLGMWQLGWTKAVNDPVSFTVSAFGGLGNLVGTRECLQCIAHNIWQPVFSLAHAARAN
ncbi:hypothetical protein F5Y04DRAFT_239532 [Hypomontagnella monticulosa]|nr:hypothetical protein F5Y04DRAFT_239532 [Hypomontagnella monticulosa]